VRILFETCLEVRPDQRSQFSTRAMTTMTPMM
jgi:hypothetical protein